VKLQTARIAQIQLETGFSPGNQKADEQIGRAGRLEEGNWRQLALFCPCGALPPLTARLCKSCYWKWRHSLRFYGGRREHVLERDSRRCRACGADRWVGIHHRKPGDNHPSFLITICAALITICAACHTQFHSLLSIWKWIPALLVELWVEQHPGFPVQMQFQEPSAQLGWPLEGREVISARFFLQGGQIG